MTIECGVFWGYPHADPNPESAGVEYIRFTDGSDGFRLINWVPAVASGNDAEVVEVVTLAVEGSSHDDIANNVLQPLDRMIAHLDDFRRDSANIYAVQMFKKLDNETDRAFAFVTKMSYRFESDLNRPPMSPGNYVERYSVTITREAEWRRPVYTSLDDSAAVGGYGDLTTGSSHNLIYDYGSVAGGAFQEVSGVEPARLAAVRAIGIAGGTIADVWFAWRSEKYTGGRLGWQPVWNLTDASYIDGSDTSEVSDGDAYTGTCLEVNPTDTTLTTRAIMRVADVANFMRGTFLVLLRARATGTRTYRVEVSQGFWGGSGDSGTWNAQRSRKVSGTSWYLFPSGYINLPPDRTFWALASNFGIVSNSGIRIRAAELTAGTGNLRLDVAIVLPTNEGLVHLSECSIDPSSGQAEAWQEPDGSWTALNYDASYNVISTPVVSSINPRVPLGKGVLAVVCQRASSHELTDRIWPQVRYISQFLTLAGDMDA